METNIVQERINWLKHQIDYYGRYHDHKETMAWVATAFYLGGIVYLLFNLDSVLEGIAIPIAMTTVALLALVPICLFLKMQFNRRWVAKEKVKIYRETLILLLDSLPGQSRQSQDSECQWVQAIEDEISRVEENRCKEWTEFLICAKCPEDPYPLISEFATYLAISFVTALAIGLPWFQYCHK